jgi:tetratricopeptide (TPR) repeat protein
MTKPSSFWFSRYLLAAFLCSCVLAATIDSASPQQGSGGHPPPSQQAPPAPPPKDPIDFPSAINPWDQNDLLYPNSNRLIRTPNERDNCFLPPLNGLLHSTIGVADLQVPAKAKKEKEDACAALQNRKITDAESHLRKAVKQSPEYSSAWVTLGQLLEVQQKTNEASAACSQPLATNPNYLPAYLCLADISAHSDDWTKVLQLSTRAIDIDPANDAFAYDYNAAAYLHLHKLTEAEKSALRALEMDKTNADPRVHFLLAQIYSAKGDREKEAAQLRLYLNFATDPADIAMVNQYLSQLEKPTK